MLQSQRCPNAWFHQSAHLILSSGMADPCLHTLNGPGQQQSTVKVSFDSTLETQQVFTAGGSKSCCFVQGWTHNHNLHACCEAVCGELISATDEHCTWHLRPIRGCMQTIPVIFQQYHKTCAKDICHNLLLAAGASQRSLGQQCCQWLQV